MKWFGHCIYNSFFRTALNCELQSVNTSSGWLSLNYFSIYALTSLVRCFKGCLSIFTSHLPWLIYSLVRKPNGFFYCDYRYQPDNSPWSARWLNELMNDWMNDTRVYVVLFSVWLHSNGTPVYLHQWWLFDFILHQLPAAIRDQFPLAI